MAGKRRKDAEVLLRRLLEVTDRTDIGDLIAMALFDGILSPAWQSKAGLT